MKIKDHFLTQEEFEIKETAIPGVYKTQNIPANISAYYDSKDYISHHQDSGSLKVKLYKFLQNFNLKYKKNILFDFVGKDKTVLDYGCGAGEFVKYIENDFETLGFEPSDSARQYATQKVKKTKIINSLDYIQDETLDAITLWHVFEHIENQDEILKQFHNKLKKNGVLIIAVPNPTSYDALKYKQFWAAYDVPRHIFHFSKSGMEKLMNTDSWKIKKVKPLLLDSFYISMLSEKYQKSSLSWLKGLIFGAISNAKALKSGEFSSLIYIIEKK
ncbi:MULTISPECIES: class I SAM-dependent methyltransferase [unclassified Kaistella]|uniref:class I SAM-dependent methyltransferase n=1 Tax=unclassified Kaistella TaxID=2762626 RepID=UPI0027374822|nr:MULTISPECIES: class I SAM-dependent methyltransferase [unclassified Kaistella]MDP2452997.1 class I SAM-dependent methyltransferase [Kaistella sp. SH11-4b]MDP2455906.1 class I SAM-dependent methyltransferase [Kaistella sp. SH40-3]MDP2458810.1 class I SAM-dependent methyltransferase [Kaistella sp. SH19-2b]